MEEQEKIENPDILTVRGIDGLSGSYPCDLVEMLDENSPECLTNREVHHIKKMSGVTAGNLMDALKDGDNDVLLGLAVVVLQRRGKWVDEDLIWDAPMGTGVEFQIGSRRPPTPTNPESGSSDETPKSESDGGASGSPTAVPSPPDPSRTGSQPSGIFSTSDQPTSGT